MALADLIAQNSVLPALKANSKKQLLQELAAKASEVTGLAEREVFDVILQRERLGSTGVGNGIAIPHGKLASLDKIVGVFARLDQPVDFEALDDQPVDLVFLLLPPKAPVPITSRRFRASPVSCATATWWPSCAPPTTPPRCMPS
jgi:PTS system nitrogen regulatory IIA component